MNSQLSYTLWRYLLPVLMLLGIFCHARAEGSLQAEQGLPAWYEVTTDLNIRADDNTHATILFVSPKGSVLLVTGFTSNGWAIVNYDGMPVYCSGKYINYVRPYKDTSATYRKPPESTGVLSGLFYNVLKTIWHYLKIVLGIIVILFIIAYREQLLQMLSFVVVFAIIGALIGYFLFDNAGTGATIGVILAIIVGLKLIAESMEGVGWWVFGVAYLLISAPFWLLNRLQFFFSEPWRYLFKSDWVSDNSKSFLRPFFEVAKILLYIALTPLRFVNAVYYNLFAHVLIEEYDLFFEVLKPCDPAEGANSFGDWLVMFPVRLVKYPVIHGIGILIESLVWTVVDIFIPSITLFHGTDLTAGDVILRSSKRNDYLQKTSPGRHRCVFCLLASCGTRLCP